MWKKLAAMVSASLTVASCQTAMYKPIICQPGTALREGKCQKVAAPLVDVPKARAKKKTVDGPSISVQPPRVRQNVYGQPIN